MSFADARDRRHDLPRRTIAALQGVVIQKRLLDCMQAAVLARDAFDRRDRLTFGLLREHQAGEHAAAADVNGTSAALTVVASLLCPEQAESLTQCIEQRRARIKRQPVDMVVDLQCHDHVLGFEGRIRGRHFSGACHRRQQSDRDAGNHFTPSEL